MINLKALIANVNVLKRKEKKRENKKEVAGAKQPHVLFRMEEASWLFQHHCGSLCSTIGKLLMHRPKALEEFHMHIL